MGSRKLSDAHIRLQKSFTEANKEWEKLHPDLIAFITCSYRSPEEQHCLFIQPHDHKDNDGDGKIDEADEFVTNADSGQSKHNKLPSDAIDLCFKTRDNKLNWNPLLYKEFYELMLKFDHKLKWGGIFKKKDYCHVEIF